MDRYVIIVAGGKGLRMGKDLPKQFLPVGGKPVLMHTLEAFHRCDPQIKRVLVLPEDHQSYWHTLCDRFHFEISHRIASGGMTRFHSVKSGLDNIGSTGLVAIHDGVRPFVAASVIRTCFEQAARTGAAIPVVPVIDSIRQCAGADNRSVDRSSYCLVQTPQVFDIQLLRGAYGQPFSGQFTDDASVVEAAGHSVALVSGNRENIKITTPFDLLIAESIVSQSHF